MRSMAVSWLVVVCGTLLAGCGREGGAPSLPSVGDAKTLSADAAKLAKDLGASANKRIVVSRQAAGEGENATYATRDDNRPVELPESIRKLEPRAVGVMPELVVLFVRPGEAASHHGQVVFLEGAPQDKIDKTVADLKLKEIDREARVYEFGLLDYTILLDHWYPPIRPIE
ncbi:MAG: hypothetical protein WD066_08285 [Planctomycetaceae bacterium]